MNIFEIASRNKIRFDSPKGQLSVEDLWDLPLSSKTGKANLDEIAVGLYGQLGSAATISFVNPTSKANGETQMKFDIVKHIIDVKVAENKSAAEAADRAAKKQTLLAIIAQKETEALLGTDLDELRKQVEALS